MPDGKFITVVSGGLVGYAEATPEEIGAVASSMIDAPNGVAPLGPDSIVPAENLPAGFNPTVVEVANFAALPATGDPAKIYKTMNDGKTWKWGGTSYAQISGGLVLGETNTTAYRGDRGAEAYETALLAEPGLGTPPVTSFLRSTAAGVRAWVQLVAADITDLGTVLAGYLTKNDPTFTGELKQGADERVTADGAGIFASITGDNLMGPGNRPLVAGPGGLVADQDAATFRTTIGAAPTTHSHDAGQITSGILDVARIPVLPSQIQVTSSGAIADLSGGQQSQIGQGTVVTTTDGRRWVYTGSGSKTIEASYIILADVSPEWSAIANKPALEPEVPGGTTDQYWSGIKTWIDFAASVRAAVLTGLSTASSAVVVATDSVLVAIGKLQAQVGLALLAANPSYTGALKQGATEVITSARRFKGTGADLTGSLTGTGAGFSGTVALYGELDLFGLSGYGSCRTLGLDPSGLVIVATGTTIVSADGNLGDIPTTVVGCEGSVVLTLANGADGQSWEVWGLSAYTIRVPSGVKLWAYAGTWVGPEDFTPGGGRSLRITRLNATIWLLPNYG